MILNASSFITYVLLFFLLYKKTISLNMTILTIYLTLNRIVRKNKVHMRIKKNKDMFPESNF